MKVKYFEDTDTLFINFKQSEPVETKELNEIYPTRFKFPPCNINGEI